MAALADAATSTAGSQSAALISTSTAMAGFQVAISINQALNDVAKTGASSAQNAAQKAG